MTSGMDPRIFGRYEVRRKLAGGGMGRVFLAHDPILGREVGLKLIDSGTDQESIEVIAAERRGAMLQDQLAKREPGGRVAQIFEVGEQDGYFYIAMEYIEGEDLSELVSRGPLDPNHAVSQISRMSCSHRARRALGELEAFLTSKFVSSWISFGSLAKLEPMK